MFSRRIIAKIRILLILLPALIFNGCGQKGDLYLPDDESAGAATQYVYGLFLV
ncbi:MAG: lipoprotein [Gammaproteobacteria bacterium]|nr:lipoprotein [Gammaproteobacteria bacterium]